MRVRRALLLVVAAGACAPAAAGAPVSGIARPADEHGLSPKELGQQLYAGNCSSCHGDKGEGVPLADSQPGGGDLKGAGPALRGVGPLASDFYLRTGRMPLGHVGEEPARQRPYFSAREIRALNAYVGSLAGGPEIPDPHPEEGNLSEGLHLFTEHCAGCHQIAGEGGVVTGARVPPLGSVDAVTIAEAVRIGPYLMPRFSERDIGEHELDSIIRYVRYASGPDDRGGWGIGHLGPIPEGMVAWLLAGAVLVGLCMLLGERMRS